MDFIKKNRRFLKFLKIEFDGDKFLKIRSSVSLREVGYKRTDRQEKCM